MNCTATKKDGSPCLTSLGIQNGLCRFHDPARARAAQAEGGRAAGRAYRARKEKEPKNVPPPPKTLDDAVRWSSWATHAVAVGQIDARTGHEIGYLVNAFKSAVEKRDLEREVQKLREQLAEARKSRR